MASIQGIYLALFGRPVDPGGLAYWNEVTNGGQDLSKLIGGLTSSSEYLDRFEGQTSEQIVTSIYTSLFGRAPDAGGLEFFVDALESGSVERIAIQILDGAQGEDLIVVQNKEEAADIFTASLDTPEEIAAYVGEAAAAQARDLIDDVTADPASIPTAEQIAQAIEDIADGETETPPVTPPPPADPFTVTFDEDEGLVFGGTATGSISVAVAEDGRVIFTRAGINAELFAEDGQIIRIFLDDGRPIGEAFATISEAVDGAGSDSIVLVGSGTYAEDIDVATDGLTLTLAAGAVIEGGIRLATDAQLNMFNGEIDGGLGDGAGVRDGIYLERGADVTVVGTRFSGNYVAGPDDPGSRAIHASTGGVNDITLVDVDINQWTSGVYLNPGDRLDVSGSTFTGNLAAVGTDQPGLVRAVDNTFSNNGEAFGFTSGTLIGEAEIEGNNFENNGFKIANYVDTTPAEFGRSELIGTNLILVSNGQNLQSAVDIAPADATILIDNGTYAGQITVTGKTNITFEGVDEAGVVIKDPAGAITNNAMWGGDAVYAIAAVLNSTDITFKNLTIDGGASGWEVAGGGEFVGIYYANTSGIVEDVTVKGIRDSGRSQGGADDGPSGMQRGLAVVVNNDAPTGNNPRLEFSLIDSTIKEFQKNGTYFSNADLTVTDNLIVGYGATPVIAQNGMQIARSTGEIVHNTIENIAWTGWDGNGTAWYSSGIIAYESVALSVTGNRISGAGTSGTGASDPRFTGIDWSDNDGGRIAENTITSALYGVSAYGYSLDLLSGLTTAQNTMSGISIYGFSINEPGYEADQGTLGLTVSGSAFDDYIAGNQNALDDTFHGGNGNDTLIGGMGRDRLFGGVGNDRFVFAGGDGDAGIARAGSLGADVITDFGLGDDRLVFSEAVFGDLDGASGFGALSSSQIAVVASTNASVSLSTANGGFVIVGSNTAGATVELYFVSSGFDNGSAVGGNPASVKLADIRLIGSGLTATDFETIA